MKLYSVYDRVSKRFNAPFVAENDNVAERSFQFGLKDKPFASDMDLYSVGEVCFEASPGQCFVTDTACCFVCHFVGEVIENG